MKGNSDPNDSTIGPLTRSQELLGRANKLIPGASQSHNTSPTSWIRGAAPTHIARGKGSHVWDVDGNEYIDHISSGGAIVLGHDEPVVSEAVTDQVSDGTLFSLPHPLQIELAQQFVDIIPCAEAVRFGKNGNDVTTLAAKLARSYTDRNVIATQGYHGWPDIWTSASPQLSSGVPYAVGDFTVPFEYNNIENLERIFRAHPENVAAVVMSPVSLSPPAPPENDFLERVRELTREQDALLIFDEIITGFRYSIGGAQEHFGVTPDLACFAKAMGNGYPISAIAGRRDVMDVLENDDFFFTLTYANEAVSLAAANACLSLLRREPVIEHVYRQGKTLQDGYNELAAEHSVADYTRCHGYPACSQVYFRNANGKSDLLLKTLFVQECLKRGILFFGAFFPNYSHRHGDIQRTLGVFDNAMAELATAIETGDIESRLEGDPLGMTVREQIEEG
ncbi:aminotransferase class III-fold pyridoxal phosphate-dependent enzyme [Halocatena pleomorpha]|uniref:Glutamate-1-semialdehyde 2,1-aminomutase n=1 Tax=Halocatena pleomorpha TaxID=1785090 RepID=A0A3P3RL91_9EURY|nr:aminotransferase class III-fold pyridoxal phosphate-dependent enzyme [Halocatena pleomorpha]RRJ34084.1 aminotransferase class III-fold pyridoxal phosphate-dependent enzyme [Halocatena pleomorpha]